MAAKKRREAGLPEWTEEQEAAVQKRAAEWAAFLGRDVEVITPASVAAAHPWMEPVIEAGLKAKSEGGDIKAAVDAAYRAFQGKEAEGKDKAGTKAQGMETG